MKILDDFLAAQLKPEQHNFIDIITRYCYEKLWDPRENPDDPSNYLAFLTYSANAPSINDSDIRILLLLEICLSIGISLIDDFIDKELTPIWAGIPQQVIINLACLFTCTFPQRLILQSEDIPQKTKVELVRLINEHFLHISAGEYKQVSNSINYSGSYSLRNNIEVMRLKTGKWKALIAAIAICYAGKAVAPSNNYIRFAIELGVLRQIKNDVYDVMIAETSQDLSNGVFDFPITAYMFMQNSKNKKAFLEEVEFVKKTKISNTQLREQLTNEDLIAFCVLILNLQKYKLNKIIERLALSPELKLKYLNFINE